jgi:hypothetical protein
MKIKFESKLGHIVEKEMTRNEASERLKSLNVKINALNFSDKNESNEFLSHFYREEKKAIEDAMFNDDSDRPLSLSDMAGNDRDY